MHSDINASVVARRIVACWQNALLRGGLPVLSPTALMDLVSSFCGDVDVSWAMRGMAILRYGIVAQHFDDKSEAYDLDVIPAILTCLQIPDSSYGWAYCKSTILDKIASQQGASQLKRRVRFLCEVSLFLSLYLSP